MLDVITSVAELPGKTIQAVHEFYGATNSVIVVFTDDSFWVIGCNGGYDGEADIVTVDSFDPLDLDNDKLIEAGIITADELDQIRIEHQRVWEMNNERRERNEYNRLKKKFG